MELHSSIQEILISQQKIEQRTRELAEQITKDYENQSGKLLLLSILKGSVMFTGELMKYLNIPCEIDFMKVSSYKNGTESTLALNILLDLNRGDLPELDIIIIEDIIDTGNTLSNLVNMLKARGAKSVKLCTLLDKPSRRLVDLAPDYCGFEIPDEFVVGFGLDYAEELRNLPYIGILKREVYSKG